MEITKITLHRAEGLTAECIEVSVVPPTLENADAILRKWARTAPEQGYGYHKTDVFIEWEDGFSYRGRYDLQREDMFKASIQKHIQKTLEFAADNLHDRTAREVLDTIEGRV